MEDIALHQRFPERRKTRLRIKRDGVVLRVARDARETAPARIVDERVEKLPSEPAPTIRGKYGHASHLRGGSGAVVAARGNRLLAVANQRMTRISVGTVMVIDLFFRRHVLFIHEYDETYHLRGRHPFAIVNIE